MYLNLDNQFTPFGTKNSIVFESFTFSGGEPHIKILSDVTSVKEVTITTRVQSFNDFGLLLLAIDALKRFYVERINVFIPYFPAARQDRVMVKGEPLSVKVYAELLNNLNLNKVTVFDAHSEVTSAVLNNCEVITNHSFVKQVIKAIGEDVVLISPDGGALKKIYKVSEYLGGIPVIECSKKRNIKNGKLEGFKVYEDDLKGKTGVIVDDICDGGGTFLGLADALKEKNVGDLHLVVSHGIFNKGLVELSSCFNKIYSTDSFKSIENTKQFTQIKLQELNNDEI